jgi:hypothetical protein
LPLRHTSYFIMSPEIRNNLLPGNGSLTFISVKISREPPSPHQELGKHSLNEGIMSQKMKFGSFLRNRSCTFPAQHIPEEQYWNAWRRWSPFGPLSVMKEVHSWIQFDGFIGCWTFLHIQLSLYIRI